MASDDCPPRVRVAPVAEAQGQVQAQVQAQRCRLSGAGAGGQRGGGAEEYWGRRRDARCRKGAGACGTGRQAGTEIVMAV